MSSEFGPQRITELRVSNIKKIKVARINPDGSVVIIGGRNQQGKSSILDAITYALAGKKAQCPTPVRVGSASAKVVLELTDLTVTRTFTKSGGGSLVVKGKEGGEKKAPQELLNSLYSHLSFDPLAFVKMAPKVQAERVRELVGLDFSEMNRDHKRIYEARAEVNKNIARARSVVEGMTEHPDAPNDEVSVVDLFAQLKDIQKWNDGIDKKVESVTARCDRLDRIVDEIKRREMELEEIKAQYSALSLISEEEKKELALVAKTDTAPIEAAIAGADETNRKVRANKAHAEAMAEYKKYSSDYDFATWQLNGIDDSKRTQLEEAKWPIEGMSFGDEGILVDDLPFEQASSARQLKVSVAMGLAMNPTLKLLLIRDGSLLDEDSMALMQKMAEEADAQVFIERVGKGDECQVIIEDGMVEEQGPIFDDGPEEL